MNYQDFETMFTSLLSRSGLRRFGFPTRSLNLDRMGREFRIRVEPQGPQDVEPFLVTCEFAFTWDALQSARTDTSEDDFLMEVNGFRDGDSAQRFLRLDVKFSATLPYGKPLAMPSEDVWKHWSKETHQRLERLSPLLPNQTSRVNPEGYVEVLAFKDAPSAEFTVTADGAVMLEGLHLSGWQGIQLPRQWSSSEQVEVDPNEALVDLFSRVRNALQAWMESLDHFTKR